VPLGRAAGGDDGVTQGDGPTCEKVGLLKMDFLGLRTLSTIELALRLVRESMDEEAIWRAVGRRPDDGGPDPLDLDRVECNDQRVLALFRRADTSGVFQFESAGMRKLLLDMQPDRLEDLIAANALFRPGPMDLIPEYCLRKHGRQPVPRAHEIVDRFTAETYGIMVYQEQVMQIVHGLGDIPLRQAYSLIKAISKKKHSVIDAERSRFIDGARGKGLAAPKAEQLFDLVLKFAGYGFNKSHSTGYAIIAYQTAYLKAYFPAHYMAAVLTYESGARKVEEWAPYVEDCRRTIFPDHTEEAPHVGIDVRPPDLNLSRADFSVVYDEGERHDNLCGHVRFGLGAIKGAGRGAIRAILDERDKGGPFRSLFDFCERVPTRTVNKAVIEALVRSGAFDSIHGSRRRAAVLAAIDDAMAAGQHIAEDRRAGQLNMFEMLAGPGGASSAETAAHQERPLPAVPEWDELTTLAGEKETLGIHVSGHPLDRHEPTLRAYGTTDATRIGDLAHETPLVIGGVLSRVRFTIVKQGKSAGERMAIITLSDRAGSVEGVVFSSVFARDAALIAEGAIVMIAGRADTSRGAAQVIVDRVMRIEDAPRHLAQRIEVTFAHAPDGPPIESLMQMAAGHLHRAASAAVPPSGGAEGAGRAVDVLVRLRTGGRAVTLKSSRLRVVPEPMLIERLAGVVGEDNVRVVGGGAIVAAELAGKRGAAPRRPALIGSQSG
jgi:DNA polymerase-3 subunit alpha